MSGISALQPTGAGQGRPPHISLFDSDGLPWSTRLSVGWIIFLICVTGGLLGVPIGLYLGLWLKKIGRSASVLVIYSLVACSCAILFLPDSVLTPKLTDAVGLFAIVLWYVGAFVSRLQIKRHYVEVEGSEFHLNLLLTILLTVWYLNYQIRPEFPIAE